jgi:hypothetical protein
MRKKAIKKRMVYLLVLIDIDRDDLNSTIGMFSKYDKLKNELQKIADMEGKSLFQGVDYEVYIFELDKPLRKSTK